MRSSDPSLLHPTAPRFVLGRLRLLGTCLLAFATSASGAQDWPSWRGPDGDNVSKETGWSSSAAAEPCWTVQIGRGYSSPVVAAGRVYTTGYDEAADPRDLVGVDRVQCFALETGERLWVQEFPALAYANEHGGGALSTPTVHEGVLYAPSRKGELRAFDAETGEVLWAVDLAERHGVDPGRYGFASSPVIDGASLVLNAGRTLRIARASGETEWISEDHRANYSTVRPILLPGDTRGWVVFGEVGLVVIDADSGATLRSIAFRKTPRNVEGATPIVMGTRAFISSGYDQGGVLVDFAPEEPELLWRTRRMRNKMAGSTLYDGHLYGFDESMLKCMDLEGGEVWRERGLGHGALSISDGRLLVTTSEGELLVAAAGPEGFEELSRRPVIEGGVFWAAPVLVDGRVLVRGSLGDLVCLDHRAGTAAVAGGSPGSSDSPAGDLPTPAALEARYFEVSGLDEAPLVDLQFEGRLHNDALGLADRPATWAIGAGGRWFTRFDLPPGFEGKISLHFDGETGWTLDPYRGDALLEGVQLAELRATSGFRLALDPLPAGLEARTVGVEPFRGSSCFRVDVALSEEASRSVFFDQATGLVVGRTAPEESTVVLGAWREVQGRRVPMHRTTFHPETGEEERWRFTEVAFDALDDAWFELPESLAPKAGGEEDAEDEDDAGAGAGG